MRMRQEFLRDVQRAGWRIEAVGETSCTGRCPRTGCGMLAVIKDAAALPVVRPDAPAGIVVRTNEEMRLALREKREKLRLTQEEVEACAGLTQHHLAKAEKAEPSRKPTIDTWSLVAETVGYQIVLVPLPLPATTLAAIERSREAASTRLRDRG